LRVDLDVRRAPDVRGQVRDGETTLTADLGARGCDDHGVHEHEQAVLCRRFLVARHVHDDHPDEVVELRRGESDAVAEGRHRVDEVRSDLRDDELIVLAGAELPRLLLQRRVRVAKDLADGHRGLEGLRLDGAHAQV
jgi:hypothetical protein